MQRPISNKGGLSELEDGSTASSEFRQNSDVGLEIVTFLTAQGGNFFECFFV